MNKLPESYGESLQKGTTVVQVTDLKLAACLVAVGIALRKDPPYIYRRVAGEEVVCFNFFPTCNDGVLLTTDLVQAWKQDMVFIQANPMHPFTFAMCALKNLAQIQDHIRNQSPFITYRKDGPTPVTMLVKRGSKREEKAKQMGFTEI